MSRNVVLVTIDSLRADHCGYVGPHDDLTPTLDAMAADGLAFERAIAPGPMTPASMPAVFTGELITPPPGSDRTGGYGVAIEPNTRRTTIAERFAARGYETAAFTTNPYTGRQSNFARGFDHFEDFLGDGTRRLGPLLARLPGGSALEHVATLARGDRASKPWRDIYSPAVDWLTDAPEPYFLWIFLMEPHTPYLPAADRRPGGGRAGVLYHNWRLWVSKRWNPVPPPDPAPLRRLYRAAVRTADDFLAQLLSDLDDAVVAVHSDHGEAFGEHGTFGHQSALYEENVHVPLVVHGTGRRGRVSAPVSLVDLPDFLIDAATGTPAVPDREYVRSRSIDPGLIAVRSADAKYIATLDGRSIADEELYDLTADPGEQSNLVGRHPEAAAAGRQLVRRRLHHERESSRLSRASEAVVESGRGGGRP